MVACSIPFTLGSRKDSRGISDISLKIKIVHVTNGKPIAVWLQSISGSAVNTFTTSMAERDRCYSFVLSRKPHKTNNKKEARSMY
jgi:hypothetical protein